MLDQAQQGAVAAVVQKLGAALEAGDVEAAVACFQEDCYWRDLVAFTWNLRTMEGKAQIRDMLNSQLAQIKPANFGLDPNEAASES